MTNKQKDCERMACSNNLGECYAEPSATHADLYLHWHRRDRLPSSMPPPCICRPVMQLPCLLISHIHEHKTCRALQCYHTSELIESVLQFWHSQCRCFPTKQLHEEI
uniref:Uncharacterized protein MANES_01G215600 n=1 Tax=Rhizophora mucronata TaxID=61149 RepID=A0A2P2MAJ4_RHIMU